MFSSLKIYAIIGVVVGIAAFGTYFYVKHLNSQIALLNAKVAQAEQTIAIQKGTIDQLRKQAEDQRRLHEEFKKEVEKIRDEAEKEATEIDNRDIELEANQDAKALEEKLNNEIKNIIDGIRNASKL